MKECNFIREDDYDYIIYWCSNCREVWYFEDGTPEDNKYFQSFLNLAELTDDTSLIRVISYNQTVDNFYVVIGNKQVTLNNGEWIVKPYDY